MLANFSLVYYKVTKLYCVYEMSAQYLGDYAVLEADLGGGSGRYLAGHAGDHPVQRGHLVVGLVSHL